MKKAYISPVIEDLMMETEEVIAASLPLVETETVGTDDVLVRETLDFNLPFEF